MKNDSQILAEEMDKLKDDLIAKHRELGMPASGDWENSLEARTERLSGQIWGLDYTEMLEDGRKPGKRPPVEIIEKWIEDKGIVPRDITVSSLAFLIARKIGEKGWDRKDHGGVNLISQVITPARIQSIIDKVSEFHIQQFEFEFRGVLTDLAAA